VLTRAAVTGVSLPGPDEVAVDDASWLHGLAETVGELRRACLDHVRRGEHEDAERLLDLMQEILSVLVTIDAPDGLTRGLRRATDAARAITERTRGDLTTAAGQRDLRAAFVRNEEAVGSNPITSTRSRRKRRDSCPFGGSLRSGVEPLHSGSTVCIDLAAGPLPREATAARAPRWITRSRSVLWCRTRSRPSADLRAEVRT
jgi:hypothetical protein